MTATRTQLKSTFGNPTAGATHPPTPAPTQVPAPSTAAGVLYRFALAYGNVSAADLLRREYALSALATAAFAHGLQTGGAGAARGLAPGARMVAKVMSLHLGPPHGHFDSGIVVLSTSQHYLNGKREQPFAETFLASLMQTAGGWRVANFTFQP